MSCLPLFSFSPVITAAFGSYHDPAASNTDEQRSSVPATAPIPTDEVEDLYDKLSQVSVSHRRVDSFEWVMAQSAPNTPPTTLDSSYKSFSPPPARLVESAPLPIPGEMWSMSSQPFEGRPKRGYFDWWPSPNLRPSRGYTMISRMEDEDEMDMQLQSPGNQSPIAGPSRRLNPSDERKVTATSSIESDQWQPSQELNALGIVFPCASPHSPPATAISKVTKPSTSTKSPRRAMPRLPKRVSFSPVVDEVILEAFPEFDSISHPASHWGSYLPSSFLVARPPLPRSTSSPRPNRNKVTRPILKRSASFSGEAIQDVHSSTEMTSLAFEANSEKTVAASPMPTQRLSVTGSRAVEQRQIGGTSDRTDSVFAETLQTPQKSERRRCDSLLSNVSSPVW